MSSLLVPDTPCLPLSGSVMRPGRIPKASVHFPAGAKDSLQRPHSAQIGTRSITNPENAGAPSSRIERIEAIGREGDSCGGVIECVVRNPPVGLVGMPVFDKLEADLAKAVLSLPATNNSGGIQGGISNGEEIVIRVAFKPTATIRKQQHTIDFAGNATTLAAKGRHDPCVLPRAVPGWRRWWPWCWPTTCCASRGSAVVSRLCAAAVCTAAV